MKAGKEAFGGNMEIDGERFQMVNRSTVAQDARKHGREVQAIVEGSRTVVKRAEEQIMGQRSSA